MQSFRVTKSPSATSTSTITLGDSQPDSAAGQRPQGFFLGLPTTFHTPESTHIPSNYQQHAGLRLLADVTTSQVDPFDALASHRTIAFDEEDEYQEQPDDSSSFSNEPSQPAEDTTIRTTPPLFFPKDESLPLVNEHFRQALSGIVPEAVLTAITGNPRLVSGALKVVTEPDPTDKWIILAGDQKTPFKCGYEGCDRRYTRKYDLQRHFVKHTGDSPFKCYLGECNGRIVFCREQQLTWHIHSQHTFEKPYQCEVCSRRFVRSAQLRSHRRRMHFTENEKKSPKRKKK